MTVEGARFLRDLVGTTGFVLSDNGLYQRYHNVVSKGQKPVYELELKSGLKIRATKDHRFMSDDGWTELKDLIPGESKIKVNTKLSTNVVDATDEFFELYGWMHGDGWFTESVVGVSFNYKDGDGDVKDRLLPLFHKEFGTENTKPMRNDDISYQIQTEKIFALQKCKELGFVLGRAAERELPTTFFSWTLKQQLSFVKGLFTADGGIYGTTKRQINLYSTSLRLLEQIQSFLTSLGIHGKIFGSTFAEELNRKTQYRLCTSGNSSDYFYDVIGFSGGRKVKLYNRNGEGARQYTYEPFEEIISITKLSNKEEVFDIIEVNNSNCFYANGMLVHNCNLGSINIYTLVTNPFTERADIDWEKLKENVRLGVTALDEILDYGREMQPLEKNKICIDDWRAIGLGVFGLGDALVALGIRYGSKSSREFIEKLMSFISETALETSADLADEKGTFGKYNWEYVKKSPIIDALKKTNFALHKKIETQGLRNGSLLSIAPTGSLSVMCGLSGGVEPLFAISYQRTTHSLSGEKKYFKVFAKSVMDLLNYHGIDPQKISDKEIEERFPYVVVSHDINPHDRIAVQSVMQKYVDNAISSTINLKEEVTVQDVFDIYMDAWESGCKGITVFRNNCARTAILVTNDSKQLKEDTKIVTTNEFKFDSVVPFKAKEVDELDGKRFVKHTACVPSMYINITHKDGNIYEVFTNAGSGCHSNISTITRLASLAFRLGGKVKEVTKEMKANQCPACIVLKQKGDKSISNSCGNAIADAIEKMYDILKQNPKAEFVEVTKPKPSVIVTTGIEYMECPECHEKTLRPEAKCFNCSNCGYSRCD